MILFLLLQTHGLAEYIAQVRNFPILFVLSEDIVCDI